MSKDNPRFQVRDTREELEKLEKAIKDLGYKDKADWYRDKKREAISRTTDNEVMTASERLVQESKKRFDKWLDETTDGLDLSKYKLKYEIGDTVKSEDGYSQTMKVKLETKGGDT